MKTNPKKQGAGPATEALEFRGMKPVYLMTAPYYLAAWPWTGADGKYSWRNDAYAALHSLLAGLRCDKPEDQEYWLKTAAAQIKSARGEVKGGRK